MRLSGPPEQPQRAELDVMRELLPLDGARVLELGCGAAQRTWELARETPIASILGAEVDPIAHGRNVERLAGNPTDRVAFAAFGAEAIEAPDESFDVVIMLKSLHHVPGDLMPRAFDEIHRVLEPGGVAYVSEPVFAGDLNEVIRLFHDEEVVRRAAFEATRAAVEGPKFELEREVFFLSPVVMQSFEQFRGGVMSATHTEHRITPALETRIEAKFESFRDASGEYRFEAPIRVDLLRKVA